MDIEECLHVHALDSLVDTFPFGADGACNQNPTPSKIKKININKYINPSATQGDTGKKPCPYGLTHTCEQLKNEIVKKRLMKACLTPVCL